MTNSMTKCDICESTEKLITIDEVVFCEYHSRCKTCEKVCKGGYWACACEQWTLAHSDYIYCSEACMDEDHDAPEEIDNENTESIEEARG